MAYVVEVSEQEEANLGRLTPSPGLSMRSAISRTADENPTNLIYDAGVLKQANAIPKARLSVNEAGERVKAAGVKLSIPEDSYTPEALDILIARQKRNAALALVNERTPWSMESPVRGAAQLLTGLFDPLNVASAFVPVVGQTRAAAMMSRAGTSAFARAGARAQIGAIEGAAGAAMLEPIVFGMHSQLQDDYGMADSLINFAFGAALGGGLHSTVGAFADMAGVRVRNQTVEDVPEPRVIERTASPGSAADVVRAATPEVREAAMRVAIADTVQGRVPDVEPVLRSATRTVDLPEFKAWFGESKVTDESGAPLVVYHGTRNDFDQFDPVAPRVVQADPAAQGLYFTRHADDASGYATGRQGADGANVQPVYVALRNPYMQPEAEGAPALVTPARRAELEAQGYDGIIYRGGDEVVAFRPEQVKSAIGNSGRFDPNSASLTDPLREGEASPRYRASAVADDAAARAADERLKAAPADNGLEAAQAELDAATQRLDAAARAAPELADGMKAALKPFDDAIADAKNIGEAIRALANCGTRT